MANLDAYVCPKCGASLRAYDGAWDFSFQGHLWLQLAGAVVFGVVLLALARYEVVGVLFATLAAAGVTAYIAWRVARARAANQPERYSCPKCLRLFWRSELQAN
jgi:hypothetical protein